tara:strand:- start:281 stop:562 length:282 start_codon:yes stop_codon:yes gene_type:complete
MFVSVPHRNSSAVSNIEVDALSGEAIVTFKNGLQYLYENVSKRSIINVLFNPDVSLGRWVNNNCINTDRTETLSYQKGKLEKAYKGAQLPEFA